MFRPVPPEAFWRAGQTKFTWWNCSLLLQCLSESCTRVQGSFAASIMALSWRMFLSNMLPAEANNCKYGSYPTLYDPYAEVTFFHPVSMLRKVAHGCIPYGHNSLFLMRLILLQVAFTRVALSIICPVGLLLLNHCSAFYSRFRCSKMSLKGPFSPPSIDKAIDTAIHNTRHNTI